MTEAVATPALPVPPDFSFRLPTGARVAVMVPCFNEELTIGKVIDDFRRFLPDAAIYVFNNRSTDDTVKIARERGAIVVHEPRRGKGHVVAAMFARVDADYLVMVDGDDTYSAEHVSNLLGPLVEGIAHMVVATRLRAFDDRSFRPLHVAGNKLVCALVNRIFSARLSDIMSGYRAFTRRVLERLPIASSGFEVETEITVNALYHGFEIFEIPAPYRERPEGSLSKLRTFSDGFRVLWKIFSLVRAFKPLTFFGSVGLFLLALGVWAGYGPVADYVTTGLVPRLPRAVLATGLILLSAGSTFFGLLLHTLNWRLKELHSVIARHQSPRETTPDERPINESPRPAQGPVVPRAGG